MICQPRIYFSLVGSEEGGLCFNDLNSSKLNHLQEMSILTADVCFKFIRLIIFDYNKNLKLFGSTPLFYT